MVSKDVTIRILMDDSGAEGPPAKIDKNQAGIDEQQARWAATRQQILLEMHSLNLGIGMLVQSLRMVARVTGETLNPMENALLTMLSSTASLMVATATAMAAGSLGLLAGAALVLMAAAYGLQVGQTIELTMKYQALRKDFAGINARLAQLQRRPMGVSF